MAPSRISQLIRLGLVGREGRPFGWRLKNLSGAQRGSAHVTVMMLGGGWELDRGLGIQTDCCVADVDARLVQFSEGWDGLVGLRSGSGDC